ncbi:hypothetical protein JDN40_10735 [Rhodomicrobium vannielii ATCC 17100]|nr:hypothetical protein [Rhodomicrobium vannielii ATCC 17100]
MRDFKRVIYIDADTVTNRDLCNLLDLPLDGCCLAAVRDFGMAAAYYQNSNVHIDGRVVGINEYITSHLGLSHIDNYFNSGVLVLDIERIRILGLMDQLISEIGKKPYWLVDQDILNIVFEGKVRFIDSRWNFLIDNNGIYHLLPPELYASYLESSLAPNVVHFVGSAKPWLNPKVDQAYHYWRYAAKTPLYEKLLRDIRERHPSTLNSQKREMHPGLRSIRSSAQIIGYMLFPIGKRRRQKRKAILKFVRERRF